MFFNARLLLLSLRSGDPHALLPIFLLLVLNEVGLPLPIVYESILLYTGYELSQKKLAYLLVAGFGSLGSLIGASLVFCFFFFVGPSILESRLFRDQAAKIAALKKELSQREIPTVTLGRLTPGLLSLTSVAAGILKLNYLKFVVGVILSNLIWALILLGSGFFLGRAYPSFRFLHGLSQRILLIIGLLAFFLFLLILKKILAKVGQTTSRSESNSSPSD